MKEIRILELFAGIGACSKAFEKLNIPHKIVDAVEIDKYAIASFNAVHGTNFPPQDITKWDKDIDVDLIMHGSPCFLAGEKVNTINGLKNIENIEVGDIVKSHDGTYNKVIKTMKNKGNLIYDIKSSAVHNINTTFNHPFYVLRDGEKCWVEAKDLRTTDYLCIPINKESRNVNWSGSELHYNKHIEVSNKLPFEDDRFWYLIGRFIGDGWVVRRPERNNNISGIKICCGKQELEELTSRLGDLFNYCVVEDKTTYKLQFTNKELGEFCNQFGVGAINKHIPQNILDIDVKYLKPMMNGLLESDGCFTNNQYKYSSISKELVYNVGELVLKVLHVPYRINKSIRTSKCIIEGREVNQHNSYTVSWRLSNWNDNINYVDDDYLYSRIRKIGYRVEELDVYNLEVEDTHTYCVNNVAVHNCQDFSLAGLQAGGDEGSGTRSSLMYESLRIIKKLKPKYVVWENVKNLISDKHVHNFEKYLNVMEMLGYENNYKVMNAKDYGIPQNRERVFTVSIRKDLNKHFVFPLEKPLTLKLKDMLEDKVDEKYYLSDKALYGVLNTTFYQSSLEGRTETKDGVIPTLAARDYKDPKLVVEDALMIKNATEKGFLEATEGDGVDISGRMKFHRGNVQKDMIQTITTDGGNSRGVVVGDNFLEITEPGTAIQKSGDWGSNNYSSSDTSYTICVNPKSDREQMVVVDDKVNVIGNYSPSGHNAARIVDSEGIAPTVMENHGTVTATVVPDDFSGAEVLKSVRTDYGKEIRKDYEAGNIDSSWSDMRELTPRDDGIINTLTTVQKDNYVLVDTNE